MAKEHGAHAGQSTARDAPSPTPVPQRSPAQDPAAYRPPASLFDRAWNHPSGTKRGIMAILPWPTERDVGPATRRTLVRIVATPAEPGGGARRARGDRQYLKCSDGVPADYGAINHSPSGLAAPVTGGGETRKDYRMCRPWWATDTLRISRTTRLSFQAPRAAAAPRMGSGHRTAQSIPARRLDLLRLAIRLGDHEVTDAEICRLLPARSAASDPGRPAVSAFGDWSRMRRFIISPARCGKGRTARLATLAPRAGPGLDARSDDKQKACAVSRDCPM